MTERGDTARDDTARDAAVRGRKARDATAQDGAAHEATAQDGATHEATAQDATAPGGSAHGDNARGRKAHTRNAYSRNAHGRTTPNRSGLSRRRVAGGLAAAGLTGVVWGAGAPGAYALGRPGSVGRDEGDRRRRAHHDVLFVSAHPDDEASCLSTFGYWRERHGWRTGVVTVTRGEGGGNAVGTEEGAPLGMIREAEERAATGLAGIENIFYLDKPDFWYTLNAPLTEGIWDRQDALERVVRLVRMTTPHTLITMDPRPFNQHGAHQTAARLAIEAYRLAGEPTAFPDQLTCEGLRPWRARRLLTQNYGFDDLLGPEPPREPHKDPDTGLPVFGVWSGRPSRTHGGRTWAQVERDAQRKYLSQGWAAMPPEVPTNPDELGSDWFTVLADGGHVVRRPVREQERLRPVYAEFRDWARRTGMPWLANNAQPDYPEPPSTTVPEVAQAPVLDGRENEGEYPGETLKLVYWEGEDVPAEDISATAKMSRHADDLYLLVTVTDDIRGTSLDREDAKRHWRTDAVEIAIDPRGNADHTAAAFKAGIFPFLSPDGRPAAARDADNHQGPAEETAPGMRVASTVSEPYRGYTVEAKIPLGVLPAAADPSHFAVNILVYDSDTQDKTGQTRLAWSPFGSAQADPYVWGTARLEGYTPPPGRPTDPVPPRIPTEAAQSADSPASVEQSKRTGVPLGGGPLPCG